MVTGGLSVGSWGWALVDEVRDTAYENALELKYREAAVSSIPEIEKTTEENKINIYIICQHFNLSCVL